MRLDGWKDIQSVKSTSSMLYLELISLNDNDKKHKMNTNNNRLKRPIYQLRFKTIWAFVQHSYRVLWISQSVCATWVLCVQLCNYSKTFFLMQSFFQNISQCNREKNIFIWTSTQTCVLNKTIYLQFSFQNII